MYVKLFKSPDFTLLCQVKLEQLGSDPRAQILAKLILEDIKEAIPHIYIDEEKEIAHIINHCVQLLSSLMPIMRNDIELSTGVRAEYKIRQAQLEERLVYNRGVEDKVIPQLESILSANGHSGSSIDIILNGDELNTNYFKDKLTKKFPVVFGVGSSIESKILKYIFYDIFENSYKVNQKITLGHSKNGEKSVSVSKMPPGITTPPVVKMPPVLKVPPVPNKKDVNTQEKKADNKLEVKTPPIIKPEVKLPPVIKDVKKVNIPLTPPSKGKVPPPPSPVKKK